MVRLCFSVNMLVVVHGSQLESQIQDLVLLEFSAALEFVFLFAKQEKGQVSCQRFRFHCEKVRREKTLLRNSLEG